MLALLLGACVGAGSLGRPNLFLLLAASLPLWIIGRARSRRRGIAAAAVFAAGVVLFLLPPIVYNARATRRFVPVTAHGGVNFYIGNRLGSLGVYSPPDDMRSDMRGLLEDAHFLAERETGRTLTDAEVSQYYLHRAFAEIRRDPAAWLRLLGKKLALFWNHIEVPDVPNVFFVQTSCPVLSFLFLPFAAIAPLAIGGFLALWRSGRNRGIAAIFLSAAVLSVILFFVNSRYRLPALPVLLVLAAFFIAWGAREASRRRFRPLLLVVAPACAVLLLATLRDFVRVNRSAAYSLLGNYYIDRGDETKAAEAFTEAYRLDPARAEAMVNYARVLMRANDFGAAAALYERAYALNPRIPRLALEYGTALERTGRREEAKRLYEEGVSAPRISERVIACRLLAQAALADGDRAEAIRWVRRAIEMAPGDSDLTGMLRWLETGGSQ
jgi:tetratricopeptide (TPR) repeat protein